MNHRLWLAILSTCALISCGQSADVTPKEGAGPVDPTIDTPVTNYFGNLSDNFDFGDVTIESDAPESADGIATFPRPGANGVDDCDYTGATAADVKAQIATTIFIPAYNEGETMPLVLHSHGWGGSRNQENTEMNPEPIANTFEGLADMVGQLWLDKYIVISFDERGWGESSGQARVIDPCFETVDAMSIISWAVENLPVTMETTDDPMVGGIGGSYGGAFQMQLAMMDPRMDSIMPVATWHSLADSTNRIDGSNNPADMSPDDDTDGLIDGGHSSLITNEIVKRGYVQGLCTLAVTANANKDPLVDEACIAVQGGSKTGASMDTINAEMRELFSNNGMINTSPAWAMDTDVLLVQGMRDVVFNGNEAYDNYQHFSEHSSGDVHLVTHDGGHMLTTFDLAHNAVADNTTGYQLSYQKQGKNTCGSITQFQMVRDWLDFTLRGGRTPNYPDACIDFDGDNAITSNENTALPAALDGANIDDLDIYTITDVAVNATNTTAFTVNDNNKILNSPRIFHALTGAAEAGDYIAGIPTFKTITVSAPGIGACGDATAFIAIGVKKADGSHVEVDEQVGAVRCASDPLSLSAIQQVNLRLPMVAYELEAGDIVGLLLYTSHGFFELAPGTNADYASNAYSITGELKLPIFDGDTHEFKTF